MQKEINSIFIIGAGNVGSQLAIALHSIVEIKGIYSKNGVSSKLIAEELDIPYFENIDSFPESDLVLICSNDDAIEAIINSIPDTAKIAYTSGSIELKNLPGRIKIGVFYPLQTFSKERIVDFSNVPLLIEASNDAFKQELFQLALKLSTNVSFANSDERKKLHIGAVFINNFTNHLAQIAKEYVEANELNWEYLKPLLAETTNKILDLNPFDAQTGPARRNDQLVIQQHLKELEGLPKDIYKILTDSIIQTYQTKKK
jgi:predicted short-subunit dehydrogenase-like oxidoreductase (DUF2520 family)